ncbi:hypothetical protein PFICI_02277 [Pestalotiopsis fici W106-1]|uniref:(S)-ureidoglycine aminohydrolase cupin domain-containing protein n=1 Tax=Pestalotiopsis fici (strain W106-1 / CGMCC3.15140) TaxID=1229662 RepID=W3XFS2_PESFW|nr:uncharacterized protein PFICI_02277 [Pestalotiopsis fici W106-1]ETS84252.1 hypothetical protein PFICI_02277 [Pestalotiopsis fici W106-1]
MAPALKHIANAQEASIPNYKNFPNIFLGAIHSSTQDDSEKPITSGFYRIEKGATMTATYTYYEFKLVVAGDLIVSDSTGQKVKAVKGDIIYFPKGATITFETENGGEAFFVAQRASP